MATILVTITLSLIPAALAGTWTESSYSSGGQNDRSSGSYQQVAPDYIYGHCQLTPDKGSITGTVDFRQMSSGGDNLDVRINMTGFNPWDQDRLHGVHIHTYGDLSQGCTSAGGHYNPFNTPHGAPSNNPWKRHVGDFGNVEENGTPTILVHFRDYVASLTGTNSIVGRAFVVHEKADDLGRGGSPSSLTNGNAGMRLACCVIGLTDDRHWHR